MLKSIGLGDISIKIKLAAVFGLLVIALLVNVTFSTLQMNLIGQELVHIAEQDIPLTRAITGISINKLEQARYFEKGVRFGETMVTSPDAADNLEIAISQYQKYSKLLEEERQCQSILLDALLRGCANRANSDEARDRGCPVPAEV